MTLNASGPISIGGATAGQSINLELGRASTASSNLNETSLRSLAGVPSGAISMSNFYSKSARTFSLSGLSGGLADFASFTATASFTVDSDGDLTLFTTTGGTVNDDWTLPNGAGVGSGYEVKLTINSGDSPTSGPSLATWHALSSVRTWTWDVTGSGVLSANVTLEIRITSGSTVASQTFGVDAEAI